LPSNRIVGDSTYVRTAVVTGASSGIGAALCRELRARGWRIVGLSRSAAPDADEHEACDISDRAAVEAVAARVLERHPRIDLLVNNAGIAGRQSFLEADPELIERLVDTNYLGSVWCLRAFLPGLGEGSHVVNVTSVAGLVAVGPYSASKHAQVAFSRSVAYELAPRGISVHTVNPGFVETPGFPQRGRFRGGSYRIVVAPELVAERILATIERDRREVTVPRWYRPAAWVQALAPSSFARVLSARRLRGRAGAPEADRSR
jgi:NAD(P)-dependent dehydrogenase (short-subunit alcohol dehydrogenase family)